MFADIDGFLVNPRSANVTVNESLALDCVTGRSAPPARSYWSKDGAPFGGGRQQTTGFGSTADGGAVQLTLTMEIDAVERLDGGRYACVSVNELTGDAVTSESATVAVYGKSASKQHRVLCSCASLNRDNIQRIG